MFTRHFYASAATDPLSILGARPLFLLNGRTSPYGFAPALSHARMHMTNPYSSTSTDSRFMCLYFDEMGNSILGNHHSRDVFQRGFVVDNKSAFGMTVRDKGHTQLAQSVDSRKMVLRLSASQKYIKWTWFLTFTANQSAHPGLAHLHAWKESLNWVEMIPNYESLSSFEQSEYKQAMEEAYAVHIFAAWNSVRYMFLKYIRQKLTRLGISTAIFDRAEYQKDAGNLSHDHLILAIDKSTMTGNTEQYIQDLIRTSVFDIVKPDDFDRMIENGLLKSVDEVDQIHQLANKILRHNCDDRCLIRIGPGDSDKDFRCRKLNSVKDSPDCTQQSYISIPHDFKKETLEVLEDIGLYERADRDGRDDDDSVSGLVDGEFNHPYFEPTRHLAPCVNNASCNMSPVIPDFFVALKSMQNAQALDHTNGIAKYVCKYIAKFDEGNYVVLCQDIHTGQWVLGKTHLHNTKIVTSKFNEDKAFEKERNNKHQKGRDMPHFEIRQIVMGDPEVFTDLEFIELSTLPFELRPTNSIELDAKGNVVSGNPLDDDGNEYPDDAFESTIPMQRARLQFDLPEQHRMLDGQLVTYKNHDGSVSKYDMISLFSLRPPELLGVFRNPVDYYRYCHIDTKTMGEETVENMLVADLHSCPWVDCLGRRVKIHELAMADVLELVERNLSALDEIDNLSSRQTFNRNVNRVIRRMATVYQTSDEDRSADDSIWFEETAMTKFIQYTNESTNLPIPVVSNTRPENALQFLTHIILSLGEYDTEIEALTHASSRDCLREVGLIGSDTDEESLKRYSRELVRRYVEEQVVFYPNSLTNVETIIVTAKRVLDDAIIHNALSINELPPFTMSRLRAETTDKNEQLWTAHKTSQLQSVYTTLGNTEGIPSKNDVMAANRDSPLTWNPTQSVVRYEQQSIESFEEQQLAIKLNVKQINKYRTISGSDSLTYTKNPIVYGAPGTGKSFIGQLVVLYAISQGLNVISSALMAARANTLGGIHLHQLFQLPVDRTSSMTPFRLAEEALQKIKRKPELMYQIRTVDAIFLDEAATVSAETLRAIDIIARHERNSQIPFGGILILGTMDQSQIEPINQLPFLTSSLMLTCFVMVELKHSVRAHGDVDFQRLQAITRMNPLELASNQLIKNEFYDLAERVLTFVPNWDSPFITTNMMRAFSRVRPAQESLDEYRESIKRQLGNANISYRRVMSSDVQKAQNTNADSYRQASEQSIKALNRELKEPSELVLFAGGVYECTVNDTNGQYCQSQFAFMLDLPSQDDVNNKSAIKVWIAPAGTQHIPFDQNSMPTRDQLLDGDWKEVRIGCAPERLVSVRGGIQAKRLQYALKHIGAITINKSQGATLPAGLAIEITKEYSPWESGQVVVSLSRTTVGSKTVIVGDKRYAIDKMWELITKGNQWTRYTEHVLSLISINGNSRSSQSGQSQNGQVIFDYPAVYPFRMCDGIIPTDTTGYVYCLASVRNLEKIYIGQTECLSQRIIQHNSGSGAQGTEDIRDRPWAIGAYICGLSHMTMSDRMSLERSWKELVKNMIRQGQRDSFSWINAGARVVDSYNEGTDVDDERIRFILCIEEDTANNSL